MNLNYYKSIGSYIFRIEDQLVMRAGYFVMYDAAYFVIMLLSLIIILLLWRLVLFSVLVVIKSS